MRFRFSLFLLLIWTSLLTAQGTTPPVEIRDLRAVPRDIADEAQRVINAAGRISLKPFAGGISQRLLLEREGVRFNGDRVSLPSYGWRPAKTRGR